LHLAVRKKTEEKGKKRSERGKVEEGRRKNEGKMCGKTGE